MAFKFESLEIWKEAVDLGEESLLLSRKFPKEELFVLTSQFRRSADSVATNIAEGSGGTSIKDFQNYLNIAIKSCYETVSHLYKARNRKYISDSEFLKLYNSLESLVRRIVSFRNSLSKRKKY